MRWRASEASLLEVDNAHLACDAEEAAESVGKCRWNVLLRLDVVVRSTAGLSNVAQELSTVVRTVPGPE